MTAAPAFTHDTIATVAAAFDPDGTLARDLAELWTYIAADVPGEVRRFRQAGADDVTSFPPQPGQVERLIESDIAYIERQYRGPFDQDLIDRITRRGRAAACDRPAEIRFAGVLLRNVQERHLRLSAALAHDPATLARLTRALYTMYAIENAILFNGGALARADHQQAASIEQDGKLRAIDESQCWVEIAMDGTILAANRNFLASMGYAEAQVIGQHHRLFCTPEEARSASYAAFWTKLRAGEFVQCEFARVSRTGDTVHLQATYSPVLGVDGTPVKIVKCATDVTAMRRSERAEVDKAQRFRAEADRRRLHHEETLAELSQIVEDISTVTRQTSMLALNASIEAARAGAAGNSVAVVAGEVKTLSGHIRHATGRAAALLNAGLKSVAA